MKDWSCDIRCWWFYPNILWCRQDVSPGPRQEGIPGGWKETTGVWSQQQFSSLTHNLCRSLVCLSMILEIHYGHFAIDDLSEFRFLIFWYWRKRANGWEDLGGIEIFACFTVGCCLEKKIVPAITSTSQPHGRKNKFFRWIFLELSQFGRHKSRQRDETTGCIKVKHFDAWDDFEFTPQFQSRNCNLHWEKLQPFPPLWENLGFRFRVFANHRRIDTLDIKNSSFLENPKHVCFFCERGHLCKLSQRCFFLYICNQWRVVDEIFLVWKKLVVYLKGRWIKKSCETNIFLTPPTILPQQTWNPKTNQFFSMDVWGEIFPNPKYTDLDSIIQSSQDWPFVNRCFRFQELLEGFLLLYLLLQLEHPTGCDTRREDMEHC